MSARLLRKVLKEHDSHLDPNQQQQQSEEEEEPNSPPPSKNPFDLLEDQQSEQQQEDEEENVEDNDTKQETQPTKKPSDATANTNRKPKKKRKNNKKNIKPKPEESLDSILQQLSIDPKPSGPDDTKARAGERKHGGSSVLLVDPKFLKAENELRKIFGSKVVNSFEQQNTGHNHGGAGTSRQVRGVRRVAHNPRKTILVSPSEHWPRWDGLLSMELLETKDGVHYFRYVHTASYNHAQQAFEAAKAINDLNAIASVLRSYPYHIESLLTFAEVFKFSGERQSAADAISKCLFALECAWHPLFTPLQGNCRLEFTHDSNKPFFTSLFSHMKNMDRRGCHRSALEVCKLLLSLDSVDPMGALFCIDYFALRAQEYAWLERFAEEYESDNSLWMFPNFSYSLAVCRFYLEREAIAPTEKSTSADLMKQALMLHPLVLHKVVDKAPLKDMAWTQILKNLLFGSAKAGSPTLDHLINIYVERNYLIWRFPELQNLMKEAAQQVIIAMKQNSSEARDWACVRKEVFSSERNEYSHLMVSDFSDTVPTLPPEELQHFMVGPQVMPDGDIGAVPERAHALREVAGRNAAVVFLESLLPWVDYGDDRDGHPDDHEQNVN